MNWTGGRLSRHSRKAEDSVINKQKQHFARVRNNLTNGSAKRSPAKWSIFDGINVEVRGETSVRSASQKSRTKHPTTASHHDFSTGDQYRESRGMQSQGTSEENQSQKQWQDNRKGLSNKHLENNAMIARPISISVSTERKADLQDEIEVIRRKKFEILRNGDWLGLNIQRPLHLKYASSENDERIGKRRRLHSGHEAQYATAQIKIVSPCAPNHHISRRDIFTDDLQNRQGIKDGRPLDGKSDVRIFINGRERRIGVSSSTAPSRQLPVNMQSSSSDIMLLDMEGARLGSEMSFTSAQRLAAKQGGDIQTMETLQQDLQYYNGLNRHGERRHSVSSYGGWPSSGPYERREPNGRYATNIPNGDLFQLNPSASLVDDRLHMANDHIGSPAAPLNLYPKNLDDQFPFSDRIGAHSPLYEPIPSSHNTGFDAISKLESTSQYTPIKSNHRGNQMRRRLIMPSSPPIIHHPVPRSSATSRILRSDSSEVENSVAATAGVIPPLTASAVQDDEMWKSWLIGDDEMQDVVESLVEDKDVEPVSISPGISANIPQQGWRSATRESIEIPESRSSEMLIDSLDVHDGDPTPDVDSSVNESGSSEELLIDNHNSASSPNVTKVAPITRQSDLPKLLIQKPHTATARHEDPEEAWKSFVLPEQAKDNPASNIEPQKPLPHHHPAPQEEDPDAAWKKFILSSSSSSENPADSTFWRKTGRAAKEPKIQKRQPSSEISLEVHPAETNFGSEPTRSDPRNNLVSRQATSNPPTSHAPFLSSSTDDYIGAVDSRTMQAPPHSPKGSLEPHASSEISEVCLVPASRPREDPLSRYMPTTPHKQQRIVFTKPPPYSGKQAFEKGLKRPLRAALHLGRSYAERERRRGRSGNRRGREEEEDVWAIPSDDDDEIEDVEDE